MFKKTGEAPDMVYLFAVVRFEPETQTAGSELAVWPTSFSG